MDPADRYVLEYGSPCNIAFHRTEGRPVPPELTASSIAFRYHAVFILDPVGWKRDDQRVENAAYQAAVHRHMWDVYRELGYDPIRLPAVSPKARHGAARQALSYL
ncbi:MAG: hypothetical protein EX269_09025 [Acidimicrobiales bacterium]|nr:MAG: hypothetical protein EX269_09025 [Acidimicrobiales bacterium]